jgi:hypothetical protein
MRLPGRPHLTHARVSLAYRRSHREDHALAELIYDARELAPSEAFYRLRIGGCKRRDGFAGTRLQGVGFDGARRRGAPEAGGRRSEVRRGRSPSMSFCKT